MGDKRKTPTSDAEGLSSPTHPLTSSLLHSLTPSFPHPAGNLYLIGYRGTGKSSVAHLLAEKLGWPWLDMDELLESRSGLSIREIFSNEGEAGFREREVALLQEVSRLQRHVIATGGGIVLSATNRRLLRESGRAIWLT